VTTPPDDLFRPAVRLFGEVGDDMFATFTEQLAAAKSKPDPIVVELTTLGGDADVGRRIAADIRLLRARGGRSLKFFGKTTVYSAGATIMSAFPVEDRWLDRQCVLMVHCRKLDKELQFKNFLVLECATVQALLHEIEIGMTVQTWDFEALIEGSSVSLDELEREACRNWYMTAGEALEKGLIAGIV
jgi:ATP-dependent protease ClpP protease subunit